MRASTVLGSLDAPGGLFTALTFRAGDRAPSLGGPDVAGRRRFWDRGTGRGVVLLARAHAPELHGPLSHVWRWSVRPVLARGLRRTPWTVHGSVRTRGVRR